MPYSNQLNPSSTPRSTSILLTIVASTSVLVTVLNSLFFGFPGIETILGLSYAGITKSFYWQLLTYPFVLENSGEGLTASYAFSLGFNLYFLWILSTIIVEHIRSFRFFLFSILCTINIALAGLMGIYLTGQDTTLLGQAPLILSLLTLWAVLNPEAILLLFFVFPIKVKWLAIGALGTFLFSSISHLDWVLFFFYAAGPLFAYFFGIFMKKKPLDIFKKHLDGLFNKTSERNEKIIDFRTGKPKN